MGTRSLTVFMQEEGGEICRMFRMYDGYPEKHGLELANFLLKVKEVDGMEDLAPRVVKKFKKGPGEIYLWPAGAEMDTSVEHIYILSGGRERELAMTVKEVDSNQGERTFNTIFTGPLIDYKKWLKTRLTGK